MSWAPDPGLSGSCESFGRSSEGSKRQAHRLSQHLHSPLADVEPDWATTDSQNVADSCGKRIMMLVPRRGGTLTIRVGGRPLPSPLADEPGFSANICMSRSIPNLSDPVLGPPADEPAVHHP